jgi:Flp pilus assembly protein TadD
MRKLHSLMALCFAGSMLPVLAVAATNEEINEINRLHRSGDSAAALQLADGYLALRPKDAQIRFLKGVVLAEIQRNAEAIEVFQKLTEDFPELAEPYNNLAAMHANAGEYEKARKALDQALRSNPGYATAHENLGDVYAMLASRAYARALTLDPQNTQLPAKLKLVNELITTRRGAGPARAAP